MPRSSRAQTRQHRAEIEAAASRLFRERGVDAVSVVDVMSAVGLTHGGFYKHFASKEELAGAACGHAYRETADTRATWTEGGMEQDCRLEAFLNHFLSTSHRDRPGQGCPIVSLAADATRQSETSPMRTEYVAGVNQVIAEIEGLLGEADDARRQRALAITAAMVGAMTIARATQGTLLSEEMLEAARSFLLTPPSEHPGAEKLFLAQAALAQAA